MPTSNFDSILFANVLSRFANALGHFPYFFRLISGLKKMSVERKGERITSCHTFFMFLVQIYSKHAVITQPANILDFNTICDNNLCKQTQLKKSD